MKDLVNYLVTAIVDDQDAVEVRHIEDGDTDLYEVSVAQDDLGKVIGRHGRTARALRAVVRASTAKLGRRSQLEIVE